MAVGDNFCNKYVVFKIFFSICVSLKKFAIRPKWTNGLREASVRKKSHYADLTPIHCAAINPVTKIPIFAKISISKKSFLLDMS
jgi:hypothetical protein